MALLRDELRTIFAAAPKDRSVMASSALRAEYARITGKPASQDEEVKGSPLCVQKLLRSPHLRPALSGLLVSAAVVRKVVEAGDECAICYEELSTNSAAEESMAWCRAQCGSNLHLQCFQQWSQHARSKSLPVQCPLCRANWQAEEGSSKSAPALVSALFLC